MLLNQKAVRDALLSLALNRAHKFTRVSKETLDQAEAALLNWCRRHVESLPSRGKTI